MEPTLEPVAVRACLAAGRELRRRFETDTVDAERTIYDAKDAADRAAEERVLGVVRDAFPDHAVYAEESGDVRTDGPYRWVVDPLDGTNNFVTGMASFGTSVAVLDDDGPVLGVVYVPMTDELYVAKRGDGVTYNDDPVVADSDVPLDHASVGYVIGHRVKRDERKDAASRLYTAIDDEVKRVINTWSPVVHWGLLARGRLEAMVTFHADEEEQHVGELLAVESGAAIRQDGPLFVAAIDETQASTLFASARDAIA